MSTTSSAAVTSVVGRPLWFFVNLARILVGPEDSSGAVAVVDLTGSKGEMPPLHVHHREDEVFVVLEGELTVLTPGESRTVRAGEAAFAPKGVAHAYRVESERARWLAVSTPAGFGSFVAATADPAESDEVPSADRPVDMERLMAAAEAHGIEMLGPPGTLP